MSKRLHRNIDSDCLLIAALCGIDKKQLNRIEKKLNELSNREKK